MASDKLTDKQQQFCEAYTHGATITQAYITAYKPKKQSYQVSASLASRLFRNEKIQAFISSLQEKRKEKINYTAEDSFLKLKEIQALAMAKKDAKGKPSPDLSNALKAEELIQKLYGLAKEKTDITFKTDAGFGAFYAAICQKKDYGAPVLEAEAEEKEKTLSKTDVLAICQDSQVSENKQ